MKATSIYQNEIDIFRRSFARYKSFGIAIYGIGQRTAMLLPGIPDFNIVGLLDRDPANIGTRYCGQTVISLEEAEKKAVIIVISSDPSNYETIYKRIRGTKLPVYYANGQKAQLTEQQIADKSNPYWRRSLDAMLESIMRHDVVSFDIFDTLILRKVMLPQDIFRLVEEKVKSDVSFDFYNERLKAAAEQDDPYYTIVDVYDRLRDNTGITDEQRDELLQIEIDTEKDAAVIREGTFDALDFALSCGKDVWLLSDMYLTKQIILDILEAACDKFQDREKGMLYQSLIEKIPYDHIRISCEEKRRKKSNDFWISFGHMFPTGTTKLHIGDDPSGDYGVPKGFGIDTYPVLNTRDVMDISSIRMDDDKGGIINSVAEGVFVSDILNSPFVLNENKGRPEIKTCRDFGRWVLGPVITKFLIWLIRTSNADGVERLLFCARDGWFLTRDLEHLKKICPDYSFPEIKYLPASRRLIFATNVESQADLEEFARIPFAGTFREYMLSRFNIVVDDRSETINDEQVDPSSDKNIYRKIDAYREEIRTELAIETENYDRYLDKYGFSKLHEDAIVDLGFNGTNQFKYQQHIRRKIKGYYLFFNFDKNNIYAHQCDAKACFNDISLPNGRDGKVGQKSMFLESFLTAPYGMIRYIDSNCKFVCERPKKNQRNFDRKIEVNEGVLEYMDDYMSLAAPLGLQTPDIADDLFSMMLSGSCIIDQDVLEAFYFDNDIVGTKEIRLEI